MTLPLRKKHQTTAKSIRRKAKGTNRSWFKNALLSRWAFCSVTALSTLSFTSLASAQQPSWQPTRVPSQSTARPLNSAEHAPNPSAQNGAAATQPSGGVTLRWKSVSSSPAPASNNVDSRTAFSGSAMPTSPTNSGAPTHLNSSNGMRSVRTVSNEAAVDRTATQSAGWSANPLRNDRGVRPANYQQQPQRSGNLNDPFGDMPAVPRGNTQGNARGNSPAFPPSEFPNNAPSFPSEQPQSLPQLPPSQALPHDPLSDIEPPPVPGGDAAAPKAAQESPVEPQREPSPFDRVAPKQDPFGDEKAGTENKDAGEKQEPDALNIPKRNRDANTTSCNDLRARVREMRLTDISLDVSPEFGEGFRAPEAGDKERLDFASSAPVRDWTDYTGTIVANGRLIDLRNDRVVLDVNGSEKLIPLRDLSDIDVAYVAEAWNLPLRCGIGYESYAGRQFIPSAVEWKASGLCHKPLYFEDVQLERYGHETGPVLQPLLSTAHFFGNTLILPYKMGIHPPGECQYALGYYRPGNCAPYMIQPFPFSLRGAAVQAGFVTGAAALIP